MENHTLTFWDWPAKRQPYRSLFAITIALLGIAAASTAHWILGIAAAMLLISSLGEVLLPTRYRINSDGISIVGLHALTHKNWTDIKGSQLVDAGILVIGKQSSRFAFRRNKWLIRCRENQETVLDIINKQCLGHGK